MNDTTDAAAFYAPLWRHKWLILLVGVLVAGATYAYYKRQPSVFSASTQLNLASGAEEQALLNGNQGKALDTHIVGNAATLVTSNSVAAQVHALLRSEHLPVTHGQVRASASSSTDIVTIYTEARTARAAARLADAYAQVYIARQRGAYLRALRTAIANTRRQLRRIEAQSALPVSTSGRRGTRRAPAGGAPASGAPANTTAVIQAADLSSKLNQLESELRATGVQQINPATPASATLAAPMPKKNALFGFVLGVVVAAIAVLVLTRLDRRLHTLADVEAALGTPILAALPATKHPIGRVEERPAVAEPLIEPLWRTRAALQLGGVLQNGQVGPPRSILFLSPEAGDGSSTVVAGVALVQRDAGERVALVEADLRRPIQAQLLDASGARGLADVLAGTVSLRDAMQTVSPAPPFGETGRIGADRIASAPGGAGPITAVRERVSGSISVLASKTPAANPPAVLASRAMPEVLQALADEYDRVLIDAPSPLEVADALPLLAAVDGIVLVVRARYTRGVRAERLVQLLARSACAPVLGVVVCDVSHREMARHGFSPGHGPRRFGTLTRR